MIKKGDTLSDVIDFHVFVKNISQYLEELSCVLNKENLDFDSSETIVVSKYFIDKYEMGEFTLEERKKFIAYLGEVFRKKYGGIWGFTEDDSFAPNEPAIGKYEPEGIRFCPIDSIIQTLEKRNPYQYDESMKYRDEMREKTDKLFNNFFGKKKKRKKKRE